MSNDGSPIDPKALRPLFYWAGLSLHACQQFEYGIKLLLVFLAESGAEGISLPDAVAIIEDRDKKTAGRLLNLLRNTIKISDGWSDAIQGGLDARNEIIHRFIIERVEHIADPAERPGVISELRNLRHRILSGDKAVREITETVCKFHGVSLRDIFDRAAEEARALNRAPRVM